MTATGSHRRSNAATEVDRAFSQIRRDRRRGAHALGRMALRTIDRLIAGGPHESDPPLRRRYRRIAENLRRAQPAMGAFLRWSSDWYRIARAGSAGTRRAEGRAWVRRERARLGREVARIVRTGRSRFPEVRSVLTLSRSETVLAVLRAAQERVRIETVVVLESRPGSEGRAFAADLRRHGLPGRVIPDRQCATAAASCDLVVVGADAIFADGSVVHKVGTRTLAHTATRAGVPVVVVAGSSKFAGRAPPHERWPSLFDRTPRRFVSEYWTDRGVLPGGSGRPLRVRH